MSVKILFISYYFPPSGGAGVQRPAKLNKYLRDFDIEPIVITVDENLASYPGFDPSLLNDVPSDLRIYRTATAEPFGLYKKWIGRNSIPTAGFANESNPGLLQKAARFVRGNFFIPDARVGWNKFAFEQACSLIEAEDIKVVLTTSPPHSTQLVGLALKKKYGIKWISDLNDPWTDIYYYQQLYHLPMAHRRNTALEYDVLKNADEVITVSQGFKKLFESKYKRNKEIKLIYNGFDPSDFATKSESKANDDFVITYTGTLADSYKPEAIFEAVKSFNQMSKRQVRLRFVGIMAPGIKEAIKGIGVDSWVEYIEQVPHKESINYLMKSDALLLIVPEVKNGDGIIPAKLFEYLATRKPIIALCSMQTDVFRILDETAAGRGLPRVAERIKDYLIELVNSPVVSSKVDLELFDRKFQAGQLADLCHKLNREIKQG